MKPSIAFFDFDGTITTKDTLFEIIRYHKGSTGLYTGLVLLSPALVAFKLKLISTQRMKEMVFRYFFGRTKAETFRNKCAAFCRDRLPDLVKENALREIRQHLLQGHQVAVVTASAEDWVEPWCSSLGIVCIGTRLEIRNALVTGKIHGLNCNGPEKVERIKQTFDLGGYEDVFAYGDTDGDRAMLGIAKYGYYRKF
ncbi:HAD-IB family hydrolase [Chitinophaga sancti]|uniref:HAD-IB family hydrolase n=1 Tax=Chitinophaga sancti TaxID=1004 RepID=A0A1K1NBN9_9BACT|nr:HAD-IB family hydrolase [Chitinophaga sancti]WQD63360.1 HAD-IB family hydrolase [Chitinophaga sancti]WQG91014.1 HAD-IB family hydrolase [Chitinophaga sancti]SFW32850.1 HAD-superfamily subfamily IB hydrolase, TIGR01490 [Chitinophaga sancti]